MAFWIENTDYRRVNWKYTLLREQRYQTDYIPEGGAIAHSWLTLEVDGTMVLHAGYAWDGASGPAIDTSDFMRGSAFHDAFYQLMREGYLPATVRKHADGLMKQINKEDGMPWYRLFWTWGAVRIFGGRHMQRSRFGSRVTKALGMRVPESSVQ